MIFLFIVKVYIKVGNLWKNTKTETWSWMIFFFIYMLGTLDFGQNIALLCWLYIRHRKHNTKHGGRQRARDLHANQ